MRSFEQLHWCLPGLGSGDETARVYQASKWHDGDIAVGNASANAAEGARIGYLGAGIRTASPNPREALLQGLRDLGYVEGQNFVLVDRYAEGQQERLPELAVELVGVEVDLIGATTSGSAKAAKDATRTIPIVMAGVGDPRGLGRVTSLARPGGNVTGPRMMNAEIIGKRMQLLKEVVPGLVRIAVLTNSPAVIFALPNGMRLGQ